MSRVYGRSTLNLRACDAVDGVEGCLFSSTELHHGQVFRYTYLPQSHDTASSWDLVPTWLYVDEVEQTHLASRGWVVQEYLLPRRTLHLSKGDVFWECQDMMFVVASFPVIGRKLFCPTLRKTSFQRLGPMSSRHTLGLDLPRAEISLSLLRD